MTDKQTFSLASKFTQEEGKILLTGLQALVRLPLEQHQADQRQGLNTGILISGYRGSPVGGLDMVLSQNEQLLKENNIVFIPGVNEDLGATAIFGSQLVNLMPQPKFDGVVGMWYGKGPGVDRTGDSFKHANVTGVGRYGGVLAVAGDDPVAKSSTIPSHSEVALYDAQMPTLYPGNIQEVLDMGRFGFALSRYTGSWVGFKIVTDIADGFGTAEVSPERIKVVRPDFTYNGKPWQHTQNAALLAPYSLDQEREIVEGRLEAAVRFAAINKLNQITVPTKEAWLGIVAAGKTYYDVRQALRQLGLDEAALARYGIRILKIGMLYPMEPEIVRQFAQGLTEILVVEEKRAFVEMFIRDVLYHEADRPRVLGKRDEHGHFLVPGYSELDADMVVEILAKRLVQRLPADMIEASLARMRVPQEPLELPLMNGNDLARTPYFCSGCPHNRSTVTPEGSLVGGGIGCHTMVILMDRDVTGITQMGGEGAQWVGAAPFSNVPHIFQNIGDGTFFHSGSMAIRQAVAAGTNITYKILYNGAVAMTGGQHADGEMAIPELTRFLQAEGAKKIMVVSSDIDQYGVDAKWAEGVEVWERDRLDEAQRILRDISGVTVLIYDQPCAAELRRKRKRGLVDDPAMRVVINEAVCEGCGDCGVKSNCLSVFPVETEFGRKTQIHQSSCNKDYTCLEGDCPAFITVIPAETNGQKPQKARHFKIEQDLPEPVRQVPADSNIYMVGIGGTGVVTLNQILGTAALIDGKHINSLDQTGLSQKGGPVVSHLKISQEPVIASNKIGEGQADTYIVFDILSGSTVNNLSRARPDKTIAVVSSSKIPTGAMVRSIETHFPNEQRLQGLIEARTQADKNFYLDAIGLAESLFGNHMPANMITTGAAYQAGLLSLSAAAIEQAITHNGVAVEANIQAFRVGRLVVADENWREVLKLTPPEASDIVTRPLSAEAQALLAQVDASGELQRLLEIRVPELMAYQNAAYAQKYVTFVRQVVEAERKQMPGERRLSEAVARYLFKLMAYKDEYEVARQHLKTEMSEMLAEQFGEGAQVSYRLHPPFMRYLGWQKKISFGQWFDSVFRLLAAMRRLRGTPLDLFGRTEVRRTERTLIDEYRNLIEEALADLSPNTYERAVKLANLPDMIRGYEDIKMNNVRRFRDKVTEIKVEQVEEEAVEVPLVVTTP